jgi:NADH dehydrogenase with NAD(P)-binding domain protein
MRALVIGATGAVGRDLVARLLDNPAFTEVRVFVRRAMRLEHPKLRTYIVDFAQPESWAGEVEGDVAFSCLGTTRQAAGSKEAQYVVDHDYQARFAHTARQAGVSTLILVSAVGASSRSSTFYLRMKGELEDEVRELGFDRLIIVRPPLLLRQGSDRSLEVWAGRIIRLANRLGLLRSQAPIETARVAERMIALALECPAGLHVLEGPELQERPRH